MRAVVQRVKRARVTVSGDTVAETGPGLLVLLGVARGDRAEDAAYMAGKVAGLRIFEDDAGKMNLSAVDVGGEALVVPQFTLLGDTRKGRRPSFVAAADPKDARELYVLFGERLKELGVPRVAFGRFGEMMDVELVNTGPVTLMLDSTRLF